MRILIITGIAFLLFSCDHKLSEVEQVAAIAKDYPYFDIFKAGKDTYYIYQLSYLDINNKRVPDQVLRIKVKSLINSVHEKKFITKIEDFTDSLVCGEWDNEMRNDKLYCSKGTFK